MKDLSRSWSSVCADCARYRTERCPSLDQNRLPDDCIAAVCIEFTPAQATAQANDLSEGTKGSLH